MISLAGRRAARALALQVLFAADGDGAADVDGAVTSWPADFELELGQVLDDDGRALAQRLAQAAVASGAALDEKIAAASRNWRLERMGRVDRNILRLAVGELVASPETPVRVVINEAVELAKRFGTADSPAFVNGLLDRIASGLGREAVAVTSADPVVAVTSADPAVALTSADPAIALTSADPAVALTSADPAIAVTSADPAVALTSADPAVALTSADPAVALTSADPAVALTSADPVVAADATGPAEPPDEAAR